MNRHARLTARLVVVLITSACAGPQFTPRQEWVFTKFPECKNRTNAINVKLDRVTPDGSWYSSSDQTQTDFNLVAACMKEEWAAQSARLDQDDAEALRWYRSAADHGNAGAMAQLGYMYGTGRGVPKDEIEAVKWYRKGADGGNATAMNNLGLAYANGSGVAPDEAEAARWYRKAADAGYPRSMFLLGEMYESGKGGLASNRAEAVSWYRKAAATGYEPASKRLRTLGEEP